MAVPEFYREAAQVSFTLLGLRWLVIQFKYADWGRSTEGRRLVYDTSLCFMIQGSSAWSRWRRRVLPKK